MDVMGDRPVDGCMRARHSITLQNEPITCISIPHGYTNHSTTEHRSFRVASEKPAVNYYGRSLKLETVVEQRCSYQRPTTIRSLGLLIYEYDFLRRRATSSELHGLRGVGA